MPILPVTSLFPAAYITDTTGDTISTVNAVYFSSSFTALFPASSVLIKRSSLKSISVPGLPPKRILYVISLSSVHSLCGRSSWLSSILFMLMPEDAPFPSASSVIDKVTSPVPVLTISFDCPGIKFLSLKVTVTSLPELK